MNPLMLIGKVWGFLKSLGFVWALLRNWSEIKNRSKSIEELVGRLRLTRKLSPEDAKELLEHAEWLFSEGFIDIPGVDEAVLVTELKQIRETIDSGKGKQNG